MPGSVSEKMHAGKQFVVTLRDLSVNLPVTVKQSVPSTQYVSLMKLYLIHKAVVVGGGLSIFPSSSSALEFNVPASSNPIFKGALAANDANNDRTSSGS